MSKGKLPAWRWLLYAPIILYIIFGEASWEMFAYLVGYLLIVSWIMVDFISAKSKKGKK